MNKSHLRRALGGIKQRVLDEWPYFYSQIKARRITKTACELLPELPKLACDATSRIEIHMLCGERQADMGIWASWSLLRFLRPSQLWVHSDGTLTGGGMERWEAVIAGVRFVDPDVGNAAWNKRGHCNCPNLDEFRRTNYAARKLTDFHLFGSNEKIMILDSDILCFKYPEEISRRFNAVERVFAFNAGQSGAAYMTDVREIERIIGVRPPDRFNCGLMVLSRLGPAEYVRLEDCMQRLRLSGVHNWSHCWAEQTIYGIAAALSRVAEPLPATYQVGGGRKRSSTIARHYVGVPSIRPRFYTEGIHEILGTCFGNGSLCTR
jgi:hypothetical protein